MAPGHRHRGSGGGAEPVRDRHRSGPPDRGLPSRHCFRCVLRREAARQRRGGRQLRPDLQRARVQGDGDRAQEAGGDLMDLQRVVQILTALVCLAGIVAAVMISRTRFRSLKAGDTISLGVVTLSAVAFYKLLAFAGLAVAPAAAMFLANYHTFEGTHEVAACNGCHVMRPMVVDLMDPGSDT